MKQIKYNIFDIETSQFVEHEVANNYCAYDDDGPLGYKVYDDIIINPFKDMFTVSGTTLNHFTLLKDFETVESDSNYRADNLDTELTQCGSRRYNWALERRTNLERRKRMLLQFVKKNDKMPLIDKEVLFLGSALIMDSEKNNIHWGHFLIDILPKMWWLKNNDYKGDIVLTSFYTEDSIQETSFLKLLQAKNGHHEPIPLKKTHNKKLESFFQSFDIDIERVVILRSPTKYSRVIVPDNSLTFVKAYIHEEYKKTTHHIANKLITKKNSPKKIFFTRKKLSSSKIIGSYEIDKFFTKKNYEIISPEELSIGEQINLVTNATHVAGFLGTAMHNLIWTEGKKVTIINRLSDEKLTGQYIIYAMIDSMFNHETRYVPRFYYRKIPDVVEWWESGEYLNRVWPINTEKIISVLKEMEL